MNTRKWLRVGALTGILAAASMTPAFSATAGDDSGIPACADFVSGDPSGSGAKSAGSFEPAQSASPKFGPYYSYNPADTANPANVAGYNNPFYVQGAKQDVAALKFQYFLAGDTNGGSACSNITYTVNVLANRPGTHPASSSYINDATDPSWQPLLAKSTYSNTGNRAEYGRGAQVTWCPAGSANPSLTGTVVDANGNSLYTTNGASSSTKPVSGSFPTACDFQTDPPQYVCLYVTTTTAGPGGSPASLADRLPGNTSAKNDGTQCVMLPIGTTSPGGFYEIPLL